MEAVLFLWAIFSIIVGALGAEREIGFWGALLLSLLLSPLVGLIITLVSKSKQQAAIENGIVNKLSSLPPETKIINQPSITEELGNLKKLLDQNAITEEEYQLLKGKLLAKA